MLASDVTTSALSDARIDLLANGGVPALKRFAGRV